MISRRHPFLLPGCRWLMCAAFLLAAACDQSSGPAPQTLPAGEWHAFEGTWTAAGTRRTLRLGPDDRAAIFELTGSLLLTGAQRPAVGFRAQAIGFSDSRDRHAGPLRLDRRARRHGLQRVEGRVRSAAVTISRARSLAGQAVTPA